MKQIYVFLFAMICLTLSFDAQAQCDYQLELTDFFGNDWNSGANATANTGVDVTIDGTTTTYLIVNPSAVPNTPITEVYTIPVNNLSTINIDYRATSLPGDGEFRLIDSEGLLVYQTGIAQPSAMNIFTGNASCPTCPVVTNAVLSSATANEAVISWTNGGSETEWQVEYGISPYTPGNGAPIDPATSNPWTITGLSSVTTYDVYVRAVCVTGTDISNSVGPITFTTAESCPSPSNFAPITQSAFEVQFTWDANGNTSTNYEVNYGVAPFSQGDPSGTTVPGFFGNFAQVGGLMSDTCYDFYVRYDCGMGDFSLWQGPYNACTAISCPAISGLQADVITDNSLDVSWTAGGAETEWEVEYAPAGIITAPFSTPAQGTRINGLSTPSTPITGLTNATVYDVFVRAFCDPMLPDYSSATQLTVTTLCLAFTPTPAAPYVQDFESFTAAFGFSEELCWTGSAVDTYDWNLDDNGGTPSSGTGPNAAFSGTNYFYTEASGGTSVSSIATLTGPQFDLSGLTNPSVQFYYHMFGGQIGDLILEVEDFSGAGWTAVNTISGAQQTAQGDAWLLQIVNLGAYAGQTVQIRFRAISGGSFEGDIALDDVTVGELPACPDANLLATDAILDSTAILSWSENGLATSWEVEVQPTGVAQGTPAAVYENLTATNPETATGLTPETTYDYYVRSNCGVDGFSAWVGPFTFTTKCAPLAAPYTEDVETLTAGLDFATENCWEGSWDSTSFTEWNWNVDGAGGTPTNNTGPDGANSGANYFYIEGNGGAAGNVAVLFAPIVDISGLTAPALQFASHMFGVATGILHVDINDGGGFVNDVLILTGQQQTSSAAPWDVQVVDLLPYNGTGTVQVRFRAERTETGFTGTSDISIDDIVFDELPACAQPSALNSGTLTDTTAEILWNENGTAASWDIEYGPCGFTPGDGTSTTVAAGTNPFTLTGLTAFTCYEYYITADCGMGTLSAATGPGTFTTECAAFLAPFFDTFEVFTASTNFVEENCWEANADSGYDWNVDGSGSTPSGGTGPTGAFSGTNYFYIESSSATVGDEARLISPLIDISVLTTPSIQFKYHMFGGDMGTLHIDVNDGTGWIDDVDMIVGQQQTAQADDWLDAIIDLAPVTLVGNVIQVRLRGENNGTFEGDISIDDFRVDDIPTCPSITMLSTGVVNSSSVDLNWVAGATEVEWVVEYRVLGATAFTAVTPNPTTPAITVTGLISGTDYEFCVSAVCGPTDISQQTCTNVSTSPDYCSGDLFLDSGGAAGDYQNSENITYNICPDNAGDVVYVNFTFNEMEDSGTGCFDGLTIYDGPDTTFPTINTPGGGTEWCWDGTSGTGDLTQELLIGTSTSGCITLVWESDGSVTRQGWSANVTCALPPTCDAPDMLALDASTSTTADLSWVAGGTETEWDVEVGLPGFVPNTGGQIGSVIDVLTTPTTTVAGLTDDTAYEYWVRAVCAPGDESIYIGPFAFRTRCVATTAAYLTNYDTDPLNGLNNCDSRIVIGSGIGTATEVRVDDFTANSGAQHIYMYSGSTGATAELYYILPEFSDLSSDKQVEFQVYDRDNGSLEVGVITNPADSSTFTALRTYTDADMADDTYQFETVYFNTLTTTGGFIAFRFIPNGTFDALYIDDVSYDVAPACPAPSSLGASSVTDISANLDWLENGTATAWEYEFDIAGFTQGMGVNGIVPTMSNITNSITGLSSATSYEYYVRAICSPTTFSTWVGPFTFFTALGAPQGVSCTTGAPGYIWEDSFETIATTWTGDVGTGTTAGDWNFGRNGGTTSTATGPNGAFDGSGYLFFETSGTNVGTASVVSPPIDLTTGVNDELELSFYYHSFGGDLTQVQVAYGTAVAGPFTPIFSYSGPVQAAQGDPFQAVGAMLPSSLIGQTIYIQISGTEEVGNEGGFVGDVAIDLMRIQTCGTFCATPSGVTLSAIGSDSVIIDWTENGTATTWEVAVETAGTGIPTGNGVSTMNNPYTATGLSSQTDYEVYVRADCGGGFFSDWASVQTLTTLCAPFIAPYGTANGTAGNDFTTFAGVCWEEGDNTDIATGPNGLSGDWQADDFGNDTANVFGQAARVNIYNFGGDMDWLVSPEIDLGTNPATALSVTFDVALTAWNSTTTDNFGSDDQVQFLITTDSGVTWNNITTYDAADNLPAIGQFETFSLGAYSGVVRFAFWSTNGTVADGNDVEFFVDNFTVDGTVGVEDTDSFEFSFYPNPTDNLVTFNGQQVIDGIIVRNLLGQQLLIAQPNTTSSSIDLSAFPSGLYLIEVSSGEQSRVVKVIRN
jgi:hypothetical protein